MNIVPSSEDVIVVINASLRILGLLIVPVSQCLECGIVPHLRHPVQRVLAGTVKWKVVRAESLSRVSLDRTRWMNQVKSRSYRKNRPEESIGNAKSSKQEPFIGLTECRKTLLSTSPSGIPETQHLLDLLVRLLGNRDVSGIARQEVRREGVSNRSEARMHLSSGAASQSPQLAIPRPERELGVRLSEELANCQRVADSGTSEGAGFHEGHISARRNGFHLHIDQIYAIMLNATTSEQSYIGELNVLTSVGDLEVFQDRLNSACPACAPLARSRAEKECGTNWSSGYECR